MPRLFDEVRGRLEGSAFAIGTGTAQPFGVVTRGAVDATAGNPTAALIYAMDQNLPPRFRNGGKVAWSSNETAVMAKKPKQQGQGLPPCRNCAGTECGSGRVPVCCTDCTH